MIKILQRGEIPVPTPIVISHKVKCSFCKSVLEFNESDAILTESWKDITVYKIICPVCNYSIEKVILHD